MADEIEEKASGDVISTKVIESEPPPPPPKIPDVELFVDGFGFMPKKKRASDISKLFEAAAEEEALTNEQPKSPCASSTNIDIVRRYTWKTKNRMTVQVSSRHRTFRQLDLCSNHTRIIM